MTLETIGDILAVAFLVGVIALATGWLLGVGVTTPELPPRRTGDGSSSPPLSPPSPP